MEEAFIVIILCCSSSLESRYLSVPASLGLIMALDAMRESERLVLPWSTCARMQMFLILSGMA